MEKLSLVSFALAGAWALHVPRGHLRTSTRLAATGSGLVGDDFGYGVWTPRAAAGSSEMEMYEGVRIGPPPDLASLLLHNRIVYLGMPLVPAVTELIVAELLYLNYESATKPVTLYINSPGERASSSSPTRR